MKRLKIDLHIHTVYSKDSDIKPMELVKKAKMLGFDAIAVTDHGTLRGAIETRKAAERTAKGMVVFLGQEVKTRQGEILVYNMRKEIREEQNLLETCREVRKGNGFLIIPHPFDIMRKGLGKNLKAVMEYANAVEVFNARTIVGRFNKRAMDFVKENNVPMVVGSDAHFLGEFGRTYMMVESRKNTGDILKAIETKRTDFFMQKQDMKSGMMRGFRKIRTYF